MKRWLVGLFSAGLVAVFVVIATAWLTLRASLADVDGEITVTGLEATATIARDGYGIPTIIASSRPDLAFATGFAHGQDRFFQMDTLRRRSAGEISALIGAATVATDKQYRLHRFRSRALAVLADLDPADRALLELYAAGANAGLNSLGAKPFEYFLLGVEPEPWRAEDTILVVFTMFLQLNDERASRDVRRGLAQRILPQAVFAWMYPQGTPWDAPLLGPGRPVAPMPAPEVFSLRDVVDAGSPPANERGKKAMPGSNSWAVSGRLTGTGRALVANDMHLGHTAPNIYYRARLRVDGAETRELTGVTLPGAPFVVAGSNGHVAWGFTNSYGDWSDAIVLKPGNTPGTYATPVGDSAVTRVVERIDVKDGEPVDYEIRETIWGPVLDNADYPDSEIAVSWIAHHREAVNLALLGLETVTSVDAALDVANSMGIPPQNFVAGDAHGNIGWTIAGRIPTRADYDATLPADWSAVQGWIGWLPGAEYPRLVNPDSGRIWTANARVVDDEALRLIGDGGYDLGARAQQIRDSLFAKDRFEPVDMLAIQLDDRAVFLSRWRELLLDVLAREGVASDPRLAEYRRLVKDWIPRASPDSVGYRLVRAFRLEVEARVFHALTTPVREVYGDGVRLRLSNQFEAPLWQLVTEQPEHLLPGNYDNWDSLLVAAVRTNIDYFGERFGGPLERRTWGEKNTAEIRHPLSRAVPFVADYLDMPRQPLNGDVDLPKAQGPGFGASERFSVAPGDEANGLMHMPTGQSGHPLSPFYRRGHSDWVDGLPSPFLPGDAIHTLTLRAATP